MSMDTPTDEQFVDALLSGNIEVVKKIFQDGYPVESLAGCELKGTNDFLGESAIHIAVSARNQEMIKFIIEKGGDVNAATKMEKKTPLHVGCESGDAFLGKLLLSYSPNLNAQQNNGYTPMHVAAGNGHLEVVKALTECGAKTDVVANDGHTPTSLARAREHKAVAAWLDEFNNVNSSVFSTERPDGYTPPVAVSRKGERGHNPLRVITIRQTTAASTSNPWGPKKPPYGQHDMSNALIDEEDLRVEFQKYDKDNNGFLNKTEFREIYKTLEHYGVDEDERTLDKLFAGFNLLGEERLSFEEFSICMLRLARR